MYMHDLIELLKSSGYGCHVIKTCIACIFFADDMVLLSPSRQGPQKLVDICTSYSKEFCLDFNVSKSKVMIVSDNRVDGLLFWPLLVGESAIEYVSEYKYLGVTISSQKGLCFPATTTIRSFYCAANSVLNNRVKPDKHVLMQLFYSNCVPIISYACAVKEYSAVQCIVQYSAADAMLQ